MARFRNVLAMVLVLAMTVTMLPVFAAAEDAAVETVLPVADVAAAEPAPAAVEDVSFIPELPQADVPAAAPVEAIETVAAEEVKAELQEAGALSLGAAYANDAAALADGYFLRLDIPNVGSAYYKDFSNASKDHSDNKKSGTSLNLLCDYTYYATADSTTGIINCGNSSGTTTLSTLTFDLNKHTMVARCKRPLISRGGNATNTINMRNGTLFYQNLGRTGRVGVAYGQASMPTDTGGTSVQSNTLNVTDMTCVILPSVSGYKPTVQSTNHWKSTLNAKNSTLISVAGSAVEYIPTNNWSTDATVLGKQIKAVGTKGQPTTINLDNCVIGSLDPTVPAIRYVYPTSAETKSVAAAVTVSPESARKSMFLGSAIIGIEGDPSNSTYMKKTLPADYTGTGSFTFALPDTATLSGSSSYAEADQPDYLEAITYPTIAHAHALQLVPEVPATSAAPGTKAHYHCDVCGSSYQDSEGLTEATAEWLVIEQLGCSHSAAEHHAAVAPTFEADGAIEYWYCTSCETYFSDEGCTTPVTELSVPKLVAADGLTDAQMVELGAVAKAVAPGGSAKAYNTLPAAYTEGASWTTSGGVVTLLRDYAFCDGVESAAGFIDSGARSKSNNNSWQYVNKDVPTLKGFWFDLGGHTLVARTGRALFCPQYSLPINIRNGFIIYQNTAASAINYGVFKNGTTTARLNSADEVYRPEYTLDNVTLLRTTIAAKADFGASDTPRAGVIFHVGAWQSDFNIHDCTIVNDDSGATCFRYLKANPSANETLDAFAKSKGYQHTINLSGSTVVGSTKDAVIYFASAGNGNAGEDADYFRVSAEGDNVKFLGTELATITNETMKTLSVLPDGYFSPSEKFSIVMPDKTKLPTESGPCLSSENYLADTATSCKQWIKAVDASRATYKPNGGAESEETTFAGALQAWVSGGRSGTVKLYSGVDEAAVFLAKAAVGGTGTYYTTTSEGSPLEAVIFVPVTTDNGDLTLDLNNNAIRTLDTLLCMDAGLSNFDLTVKNGGVLMSVNRPILVLKGEGGCFKAEEASLSCTSSGAANTIVDARGGGAYAILNGCTISSASRSPITLYTTSENLGDGTLLYYLNNCALQNSGEKQGTISSLSSQNDTYRAYTVIVDGTTEILNSVTESVNMLRADAVHYLTAETYETVPGEPTIYKVTTDGNNSKLTDTDPAATVTFGGELSLPFAALADALEYAELFGRNGALPVTLTLNKDAAVTESKALGQAERRSAFTLDLNGKALTGAALIDADGGEGTQVTITMAEAGSGKLFRGVPEQTFAANDVFVIEKGSVFTNYSLNLEDSVTINLYTDDDASVSVAYVQDGKENAIAEKDAAGAWVVNTLAAKQMEEAIDAYAAKTAGTTTYVDFSKGISVQSYANREDVKADVTGDELTTLSETLDAMQVYGAYAAKYFADDDSALTEEELTALIGKKDAPASYTDSLHNDTFALSGIEKCTTPNKDGYYGSTAKLGDKLSLKFYFYGSAYEGDASVTVGGSAAASTSGTDENGKYHYVEVAVSAKDFDTAITVAFEGVGSVTDSLSAYTGRVLDSDTAENLKAHNLATALRAYGAAAMAYSAAKSQPGTGN